MSDVQDQICRRYEIHGVAVEVTSEDAAVAEAFDNRLHAFRSERIRSPQLRLQFLLAHEDGFQVQAPAGPGRPIYHAPGGDVLYFAQADALYAEIEGVRLRCEAAAGLACLESGQFSGRTLYLASHPLATISLHELLKRRRRFAVHAACLAGRSGGLLLAGPSGAGKSTLTLALVRAGLSFLADDTVFLRRARRAVAALGFPDAVGISADTAERFPDLPALAQASAPAGFPKRLLHLDEAPGVSTMPHCQPSVIVFPEVVDERTSRLLALDPKEAWLRLAPEVLLTEPAVTAAHLEGLGALLRQVSCYRLQSGTDLERSAELVKSLI